jgi:hypothetical protein
MTCSKVFKLIESELEEQAMLKAYKEYQILEEKEKELHVKAFLKEKLKHV